MLDDYYYQMYLEETDPRTIAEIDLKHRVVNIKKARCLDPWKRCWDSKKYLFLKPCIRVTCGLSGPGDTIITNYYFDPSTYTLRLLKQM